MFQVSNTDSWTSQSAKPSDPDKTDLNFELSKTLCLTAGNGLEHHRNKSNVAKKI